MNSWNLKASLTNTGEPQSAYQKKNLVKHCYEYNFFRSVLSRATVHYLCASQGNQYNKNISRGSDKNQRWCHKIDPLCYLNPLWLRTNAEFLFKLLTYQLSFQTFLIESRCYLCSNNYKCFVSFWEKHTRLMLLGNQKCLISQFHR